MSEPVQKYLARIGLPAPPPGGIDGLRALQEAHLRTVPFENLSIHLGEPIVLAEQALLAKVVDLRRGGFCYELNGAFAALLRELGYPVRLLQARVLGRDGQVGPPYDHLALRVDLAQPWLVDVGFGQFTRYPVRLDAGADQDDPAGKVRIVPAADGDVDVLIGGIPQYRLEPRPRALADFEPTCWWHQTSPKSHFTQSLVCSLPAGADRVTLSGRTLIQTVDGERVERVLADDAEVRAAYGDLFGIVLDRLPAIPAAEPAS